MAHFIYSTYAIYLDFYVYPKSVPSKNIHSLRIQSILFHYKHIVSTFTDLDPPKLSITLLSLLLFRTGFIETESRFLLNFSTLTNEVKFKYSLQTTNHTCWNACTKNVGTYSGAFILWFIGFNSEQHTIFKTVILTPIR